MPRPSRLDTRPDQATARSRVPDVVTCKDQRCEAAGILPFDVGASLDKRWDDVCPSKPTCIEQQFLQALKRWERPTASIMLRVDHDRCAPTKRAIPSRVLTLRISSADRGFNNVARSRLGSWFELLERENPVQPNQFPKPVWLYSGSIAVVVEHVPTPLVLTLPVAHGSHRSISRSSTMDPRIAALFRMADQIALMERRLAYAEGSELESCLRAGLAQIRWSLDSLIDDTKGIVNEMPWWSDWIRRTGPATGSVPLN